YATADGRHVAVAAIEDRFWARFCALAGLPADASHDDVAGRMREHTAEHWAALLEHQDACVNVVRTLEEAVAHPQFAGLVSEPLADGSPLPQLPLPRGGRLTADDPVRTV